MKGFKFLKYLISAVVMIMIAGSVFAGVDLFSIMFGSGTILLSQAGAIVDDTVTTGAVETGAPNLNEPDYDKIIVEMLPSRTPLDTIFRTRAKKRKAESLEVRYFAVDTKPFKDTVKTAKTVGDAQVIDLAVNNIDMWDIRDTIRITGVNGYDGSASNNVLGFNNLVARIVGLDKHCRNLAPSGFKWVFKWWKESFP